MKIRWLQYFVTVAEEQSVSRATVKLNTSQAALSRVIREMEATLAVELFQRTGRGMVLTAEGEVLRVAAQEVLDSYDGFLAKVRDVSGDSVASLRILLPPRLSAFLMRPFAEALAKKYIRVNPEVFEALSEEIQTQLRLKNADIGIYYTPRSFDDDAGELVATESLYMSGTPNVVGSASVPITMLEASTIPVLMQSRPAVFRDYVERNFQKNGYKLQVRHNVNTVEAQLQYARAGDGATILPYCTIKRDIDAGTLVSRKIVSSEIRRGVYLNTSSQATTRMQRDAIAVLKSVMEAMHQDLQWDIEKEQSDKK